MSQGGHPFKEYVWVWVALAVLTAVEVFAALHMHGTAKWLSLVVLACAKAGCVGYWYMHLKQEMGWLKFVALMPIIAGLYAVVLILEVGAH